MKQTAAILFFITAFAAHTAAAEQSHANPGTDSPPVSAGNLARINEFDRIVTDYMSQNKTVAIEFGIQIDHADPIIKRYGYADLESKSELKESDLFRIASITKIFTATAVMKLVETGKIDLNVSLNRFFPDYPNGENITVYQLISHTSGIPNWWNGGMPGETPRDFPMCDKPHQYIQAMRNPSLFKPGEFYDYSNTNYVLLGEIIEQVSGKTFQAFLKENVFDPAGMTATEMEYIDKPSEAWVAGYAFDENKQPPFVDPAVYHMPFAAGGLRSNADELLKFMSALKAGAIVEKDTLDKMTSYALLGDGRPVYEGKYMPPGSTPRKERPHRAKFGYGFGFHLEELYGKTVYYHSGGIAGFNSYLIHFPDSNTTIVLLANTEDGVVPLLDQMRSIGNEIEPQP